MMGHVSMLNGINVPKPSPIQPLVENVLVVIHKLQLNGKIFPMNVSS